MRDRRRIALHVGQTIGVVVLAAFGFVIWVLWTVLPLWEFLLVLLVAVTYSVMGNVRNLKQWAVKYRKDS
jgi:sorbitol-specific phosphotransferase system component IIBC